MSNNYEYSSRTGEFHAGVDNHNPTVFMNDSRVRKINGTPGEKAALRKESAKWQSGK
jgi:hypothetical protein